ncbi:MAG: hypothetical protein IT178_18000 [Acidobacteria bacterium]|nr:hypothetical protein [Acidobacteriota bacterium]
MPCLLLALVLSVAPASAQPAASDEGPGRPAGEALDDVRFDLPVTGGQALLERLGLREDPGTALVLLARGLHGVQAGSGQGGLAVAVTELLGPAAAPNMIDGSGPPAVVLAPFSDALWRRLLALTADADLFTALVRHRGALLVAAAALQSTTTTRAFLARDSRLLGELVRQWPGSFAQVGGVLDIDASGVVVPGAPELVPAWTSLAGASPAQPVAFLRGLLRRDNGRLARFYGAVGRLTPAWRTAITTPLPGETPATALAALYEAASRAEAPWAPNDHPYQVSYADLPSVLHSLHDLPLDPAPAVIGRVVHLLGRRTDTRAEAHDLLTQPPLSEPLPALVRAMLQGTPRQRRDHMAIVALAQRVLTDTATTDAQADAAYALTNFSRYRALLLMLDRIEMHDARVWARLVDAARRVEDGGSRDRASRIGALQGALALVERTARTGSLAPNAVAKVLLALADAVEPPASVSEGVRAWLLDTFMPALPPLVRPDRYSGRTAYESRVLQALAGVPPEHTPDFSWEGLDYTIDVFAAEHERIMRIRALLPTPGLDTALEGDDAEALAAALRALVYAPALGDPDGAVTLSPDVITRHDFGGTRRSPGRDFAWAPAQERTGTGAPWHVAGSLFGLDLALARSALRRLSVDDMPAVPTINLNDQLTLARTAVAISTHVLSDADRDAIAAAIARGRARVAAAAGNAASLSALGATASMTTAERGALAWTLAHAGDAEAMSFSLRDLLVLGECDVPPARLAQWGVISEPLDGRYGTRFEPPFPWDALAGRPDMGVLATQVPDLTLRLAEVTAARHIPAALIPSLLLYATQDYWHDVEARFADDWPAMVRAAGRLPATRVDDYVAALGSNGALRAKQ